MTQTQATLMVQRWARRLQFRGWTFRVVLVPHSVLVEQHGKGVYHADVIVDPDKSIGLVRICQPDDAAVLGIEAHEIEHTVVHELLHPRLDPMSSLAGDSGFEIGLNAVASALVGAQKRKKKTVRK